VARVAELVEAPEVLLDLLGAPAGVAGLAMTFEHSCLLQGEIAGLFEERPAEIGRLPLA
jgi:hypothetical protein